MELCSEAEARNGALFLFRGFYIVRDLWYCIFICSDHFLSAEELVPSGCEIVNLKGCYLMPGLINLHVHLNSGGKPSGRKKEPGDYVRLVNLATSNAITGEAVRALMRGYANTALHSGVTTIRTVGGISDYDGRLRNEIEEGYRGRVKAWKSEEATGKNEFADMVRKARTGMSRIPMGAAAPEGLGALVRGSRSQDPHEQHGDLSARRTCGGISGLSCYLPGRSSEVCPQDRGRSAGPDQTYDHRRDHGCGERRRTRRSQDVSGDH